MALRLQSALQTQKAFSTAPRLPQRRVAPSVTPRSLQRELRQKGIVAAAASTNVYRWPEWGETWRFLTDAGLQSVDSQRAQEMIASGKWLLVDVRPSALYEKSHAAEALSIPLFDNIDWSNASPLAYLRAAAYLVNGVSPVVPNEQFAAAVEKARSEDKGFIFYCETGGTMTPSTNFMFGKESRSLKACYRVLESNAQLPVAHLDGGLFAWFKAQLPIDGEYDGGRAGRTPDVAAAPELQDEEKS